jgi:membrane-associated protease RseP (regulator of RpoE activity)
MHASAINIILSFVAALVLHEMGHFFAARVCKVRIAEAGFGWGRKLCSVRIRGVDYKLRLFPLGAYVKMDMAVLQRRPLVQQLFVLFAGIAVNSILASVAWGTFFSTLNLALAIGNLLPIYQQDGWKAGMVICRRVFGRPSPLVEWTFTLSGGLVGLAWLSRSLF